MTQRDVVRVFLSRDDQLEPLTASEVGEELGTTRKTAYLRLNELVDEGGLETKKIGAKGRVWWPVLDVWHPDLSHIELQNQSVDAVLKRIEGEVIIDGEVGIDPAVERAIRELDIPGSGRVLKARREAIRHLYRHLKENGEATRQEFIDVLEDTVDVREMNYSSLESFWKNLVVKRGVLAELPRVVTPSEGGRRYRLIQ